MTTCWLHCHMLYSTSQEATTNSFEAQSRLIVHGSTNYLILYLLESHKRVPAGEEPCGILIKENLWAQTAEPETRTLVVGCARWTTALRQPTGRRPVPYTPNFCEACVLMIMVLFYAKKFVFCQKQFQFLDVLKGKFPFHKLKYCLLKSSLIHHGSQFGCKWKHGLVQ